MFRWLAVLFIVIPVVEMWGLISVGKWIGGWQTVLLVLCTSLVGAYLAKREGRRVWQQAKRQLESGQLPAGPLLDGLCVFAGGLLLLLPGFVSDIFGMLLLIPFTRKGVKAGILLWLQKRLSRGDFRFLRRW